ncbi:MAG: hypothetical protein NXI31_05025 [bacterium]|nr:hypothetical protein [bacterium]
MATTNDSHEAPEPSDPNQRFADRLHSYCDLPLTEEDLAMLPDDIRHHVANDDEARRRAKAAMLDRVDARTRAAVRADRAAKQATERLGARMLQRLKDDVADAIAWCKELFDSTPAATAMSWPDSTVSLIVEDEEQVEHEFEAQLAEEIQRTADGKLRVTLQAPITGFPGWNGANAMLFLGPAPDPTLWRGTWITMPTLAKHVGDAALLEYEFELTGNQGDPARDAVDAPVCPRTIRQIRLFPLRD